MSPQRRRSSEGCSRPGRSAPDQPWHSGRAGGRCGAPLPCRIPFRPAGHRNSAPWLWKPILHGDYLRPARASRRMRTTSVDQRGIAASGDHQAQTNAFRQRLGEAFWSNSRCVTAIRELLRPSAGSSAPAASGFSRRRSTRNIALQRRPAPRTRCSRPLPPCAASRRCAPCRPITTIRSTLMRSRPASSNRSRRSISSRSGCCSASTECRSGRSSSAIPIIAIARKRRGFWRAARDSDRHRIPVAVRAREVARAGDRCDAGRLSGQGRHPDRNRRSRLFRRLRRDARGARDSRPRQLPRRGGERIATLDCLNDSPEGMHMLDSLVRRELAGWL
jgi:hypothetical protein